MATEVSVGSAAESTAAAVAHARRTVGISLRSRRSVRDAVWIALITAVVALGSVFLLFPVSFMSVTSLKTAGGAFLLPISGSPTSSTPRSGQNYPEAPPS